MVQGGDHIGDDGGADQGPRGVMDQHIVRRVGSKRRETLPHRGVTGCTACHYMGGVKAECGPTGLIIRMQHHHNFINMGSQDIESMPDYRLSPQVLPLFWQLAARAKPASCGDNDGGDAHADSFCCDWFTACRAAVQFLPLNPGARLKFKHTCVCA